MTTIQIPRSLPEMTERLEGIGQLLTAKGWERAAIVWAFTTEDGRGTRRGKNPELGYSCDEFAALGIHGLRSDMTVYKHRRIWQDAIDAGEAVEVAPGDSVMLPSREYPETANGKGLRDVFTANTPAEDKAAAIREIMLREPEVAKRVEDAFVQKAGKDSALAGRVYRSYGEHHITPEKKTDPKPLWAESGFGASIYAQIKSRAKELQQFIVSIDAHRDDPALTSTVFEEIDNLERAKGLLDQYANELRKAMGVDADAVFNRLMNGEELAVPKNDPTGRLVINWIKEQYEAGRYWIDRNDLRDAVVAVGLAPQATTARIVDWDRQARYEFATGMSYVTQPRISNKRLRTPSASADERELSQRSAVRELVTRANNQSVFAKAAAAQIDATPNEIRRALRLEIAAGILAEVTQ